MHSDDTKVTERPTHGARVSTALREQVVAAARALLAGFEEADRAVAGRLFRDHRQGHLREVYAGLVTVLMRTVFVLHAEERALLPVESSRYAEWFSLAGLHARLRADPALRGEGSPDRFDAWGQMVRLFRTLHDGARAGDGLDLPSRAGSFFDPDAFPFLEGRARAVACEVAQAAGQPRVSDRVVLRVLDLLLAVDGEAVRYGELDVEQLGSVYEGLMGFDVIETAQGSLVLQPGEARRRSGSHYTPRALTQPIVEATLRPILERLGDDALPEQLLALKVCDPAMGTGAFLVESCRQLADRLVDAWRRTETIPALASDEDITLHARRLVAQRCLYGVDRNPLAVDMARFSMWLVTFARDHAFTFVDHALRCGDALVGLSREQIVSMSIAADRGKQGSFARARIERSVHRAQTLRRELLAIGDPADVDRLQALWHEANEELVTARFLGDLVLTAFVVGGSDGARRKAIAAIADMAAMWLQSGAHDAELRGAVRALREGPDAIEPFHWEVEFPEVFAASDAGSRGFDAIVGNPPWVSYAGRAAQPLDEPRRAIYATFYRSFAGYKNLQGVFVERAAQLLQEDGRLGLVLPSSMAELDGYAPTRAAHAALAECDPELPDLGEESFRGVNQPSMVLHSTRRAGLRPTDAEAWWPIARPDLDDEARRLLSRLCGPTLPAALFGERGLQSQGRDTEHLRDVPCEPSTVPIRSGGDIRAFARGAASQHAEVAWFGTRLRDRAQWTRVGVLIRQTARVPIAVRSDGQAFRNSILAGFEDSTYPADFLVAYLNSTPVRWSHYFRHRDARLGMPQVKIGHLRAIPAPVDPAAIERIAAFGQAWSLRNEGLSVEEQTRLDATVAEALGLTPGDLARMRRDASAWS